VKRGQHTFKWHHELLCSQWPRKESTSDWWEEIFKWELNLSGFEHVVITMKTKRDKYFKIISFSILYRAFLFTVLCSYNCNSGKMSLYKIITCELKIKVIIEDFSVLFLLLCRKKYKNNSALISWYNLFLTIIELKFERYSQDE
jgi:hypothetical protein